MQMINHNKLVGKVAGVDGLKTGFTDAAGYCLSATAERNGRRVIVVIMGSLGPGGQRDLGRVRDRKAIELLERGFSALPPAPAAAPASTPFKAAPRTTAPAAGASATPAAAPAAQPTHPGQASETSAPIKLALPKK
jgi:D-alanyl-D-alanine carboxypeptidase (penicillin-binding protein 5/6)